MDPKNLTEQDKVSKFIIPSLIDSGWDLQTQIFEQVPITDGRISVNGNLSSRGKPKRPDIVLYYKNHIPIAVIEAKKTSAMKGIQQSIEYCEMMDVPFAFSSSGENFILHDRSGTYEEKEFKIDLDKFPSPDELWSRYKKSMSISDEDEKIYLSDLYQSSLNKKPRYYQRNAINRSVKEILNGKKRLLLVMATGTGKTYTAFQIIWKLWKSGRKKRVLFLADRNILIDQAKINDFKPFGKSLTKITNRESDSAYEIYLSLYQMMTGNEEVMKTYKNFSKDFFDLIIIDECHRGSADEDSAWREILEYFSSATQIGLTATPKETKYISNIDYFGEPIFSYSLKQGIDDGFLAQVKVVNINLDKDLEGWRPTEVTHDKFGKEIEDRIYNLKDFDKNLVLEKRTKLVAEITSKYINDLDPYAKTIIFCNDIDHAERMRNELVNLNKDRVSENSKYIMVITGDNELGKKELDNFIDPNSRYPVIATTSKLLSTGVDAQTCKVIVIDKNIDSMIEFKQIIGRGTRIKESHGKTWFTVLDFRNVTSKFHDPDFDGELEYLYSPEKDEDIFKVVCGFNPEDSETNEKYFVDGVDVEITSIREKYFDKDGNLITTSMKEFTKDNILGKYKDLSSFLKKWDSEEKKNVILEEFSELGINWDVLMQEVGKDYEPFDLVCHVVFEQQPLTRLERVNKVIKRDYFNKYQSDVKKILEILLEKYAEDGSEVFQNIEVLKLQPFDELGNIIEIVDKFGGKEKYLEEIKNLQSELYRVS